MENLSKVTTPQIQLVGSAVVLLVVLSVGGALIAALGPSLQARAAAASAAQQRAWITHVARHQFDAIVELSLPVGVPNEIAATVYGLSINGGDFDYAIRWTAKDGYNGDIILAMSVRADGSIARLRALTHNETIGFGDIIDHPNGPWMASFVDHSLQRTPFSQWRLLSDGGRIDGVSGATITANAVVRGIAEALHLIREIGQSYESK